MIHLTLFLILLDLCILDTVNHWHNTQFSSNFKGSSFPVLRDFIKIYTYQLKSLENVKSFKYHQGFPQSLAFSLFTGKSRVPVMEKSHFKLCEGWLVTHTSPRLTEVHQRCEGPSYAGAEANPGSCSLRLRAHYHFSKSAGAAEFREKPGSEPPYSC